MSWKAATVLCVLLMITVFTHAAAVSALDFNQSISSQDKQTFDKILEPVMKIYSLVKYVATGIAALVLLFAGITYMTSGADPKKRETGKHMATYVVIGLVIIWAAPWVVNFVVA